jgi:hypothetical protein
VSISTSDARALRPSRPHTIRPTIVKEQQSEQAMLWSAGDF